MWDGTLSAHHAIYLAEHLTKNPHSRVYSIRGGAPELMGWDTSALIAARTHNLIAAVLQAFSKNPIPDLFIEYPGSENEKTPDVIEPKTLADLMNGPLANFMKE